MNSVMIEHCEVVAHMEIVETHLEKAVNASVAMQKRMTEGLSNTDCLRHSGGCSVLAEGQIEQERALLSQVSSALQTKHLAKKIEQYAE